MVKFRILSIVTAWFLMLSIFPLPFSVTDMAKAKEEEPQKQEAMMQGGTLESSEKEAELAEQETRKSKKVEESNSPVKVPVTDMEDKGQPQEGRKDESVIAQEGKAQQTSRKATTKSADDKTAVRIEVTDIPEPKAYVSSSGESNYSVEGIEITVYYDDGTSKAVKLRESGYGHVSYGYKHVSSEEDPYERFWVKVAEYSNLQLGNNEIPVNYIREDIGSGQETILLTTTFTVEGIDALEVDSVQIVEDEQYQKVQNAKVCAGLSGYGFARRLSITLNYSNGQSEIIEPDWDGELPMPIGNPDVKIKVEEPKIQVGNNEIRLICYERSESDDSERVLCGTTFNVIGVKEKLPERIEVVKFPESTTAYIDEFGKTRYGEAEELLDTQLKIHYDDGTSEVVLADDVDENYYFFHESKYSPRGTRLGVSAYLPSGDNWKVGNNIVNLYCTVSSKYSRNSLLTISNKEDFIITGVKAKKASGIEIAQPPERTEVHLGLDNVREWDDSRPMVLHGLKVRVNYEDGTEEILGFRSSWSGSLESPVLGGGSYYADISDTQLKLGKNEYIITYGNSANKELFKTSIIITAKEFKDYDPALRTNQVIVTKDLLSETGNAIFNANREIWMNMSPNDPQSTNYQKKTNVKKWYDRVYLDMSGVLTLYDGNGKTYGIYTGVKDFSEGYILLNSGNLIRTKDNKIMEDNIADWQEGRHILDKRPEFYLKCLLKKDGTLLKIEEEDPLKTRTLDTNVVSVNDSGWLKADGSLYHETWNDETDSRVIKKIADNIDYLYHRSFAIDKKGATYYYGRKILDTKIAKYYMGMGLIADESGNVYTDFWNYDDSIKQLPGKLKRFSGGGYWATDGNFYSSQGEIITPSDNDTTLYVNGQKLMTHVVYTQGTCPCLITRSDGTVWLFDMEVPENRKRITVPIMLTDGTETPETKVAVSKLTFSAIPDQTYTGKPLKPQLTIKDGSKALQQNKDYTLSYSSNVNAGIASITVTGKNKYTGTTVRTFKIKKANAVVHSAAKFTKTYGSKPFYLRAKTTGNGKLTYKSNNRSVIQMNQAGKATIKGPGRAIVTVTAAATANYNAATKQVLITVKPKKVTGLKVKAAKKKLTVSWKRDSKASGYQLTYAQNSKFKKGKKNITIRKNKTTKKVIKNLKPKKTYYVKARAYKKVGKTNLYGAYNKVRKAKTK